MKRWILEDGHVYSRGLLVLVQMLVRHILSQYTHRLNILRATPSAAGPTLGKRAAWRGLCCASSSALLSLLVVGCFECFGFPVKCAEASCFLEVVFYGFSTCGCYLGHDFYHFGCPKPIVWQAWCLHFPTLRTILSAWGHPRGPWKDTWGPRTRFFVILIDFGWFWEPVSRAFWAPMG